ncbi:ParA family protein [Roseicella sp. DB1501]|uniref:ParA family protein n=1 Tax=Roseicella sp. DB1501 TaxID=2730925 RepID=UPI00149093FA|nr:ParA family protein [Roseicella sp. DB1501]NOG74027.1 ParA family protein [Roseicella sp. DB1501]
MKVIVCASRKGGSGKTVSARHLAVAALKGGVGRVAAVDLDPMRGLTRWWQRRPEDGLELVQLAPPNLPSTTHEDRQAVALAAAEALERAVPALRAQGFGLLIVDTPPAADQIVRLAVAAADLVLVPVRPSPDDLDAVGETADLVTAAGCPMVFVVNSATKKARLTGDAAIALSQHGTVAPAILHRSDAYAASALDGLTVQEADPRGAPAHEVAALWHYVAKRAGVLAREPVNKITGSPELKVVGGRARGKAG